MPIKEEWERLNRDSPDWTDVIGRILPEIENKVDGFKEEWIVSLHRTFLIDEATGARQDDLWMTSTKFDAYVRPWGCNEYAPFSTGKGKLKTTVARIAERHQRDPQMVSDLHDALAKIEALKHELSYIEHSAELDKQRLFQACEDSRAELEKLRSVREDALFDINVDETASSYDEVLEKMDRIICKLGSGVAIRTVIRDMRKSVGDLKQDHAVGESLSALNEKIGALKTACDDAKSWLDPSIDAEYNASQMLMKLVDALNSKMTCCICLDTFSSASESKKFTRCVHTLPCPTCCKTYFSGGSARIGKNRVPMCPVPGCEVEVSLTDLTAAGMSPAEATGVFAAAIKRKRIMDDKNHAPCSVEGCRGVVCTAAGFENMSPCGACNSLHCLVCMDVVSNHIGRDNWCAQVSKLNRQKRIDEFLRESDPRTKLSPCCCKPFVKESDQQCNAMFCAECETSFCFLCGTIVAKVGQAEGFTRGNCDSMAHAHLHPFDMAATRNAFGARDNCPTFYQRIEETANIAFCSRQAPPEYDQTVNGPFSMIYYNGDDAPYRHPVA